ncbi:hypothetical protein M1116_02490 [Patescibacteria group bacterium]|nr:hypothetical protein [Patescibacteria group bacterium]
MNLKVDVPVAVTLLYEPKGAKICPLAVRWDGRVYRISKLGLHHTFREGRTLYHVFSVASETAFFRLVLNTDNLFWRLTEVSDGES